MYLKANQKICPNSFY